MGIYWTGIGMVWASSADKLPIVLSSPLPNACSIQGWLIFFTGLFLDHVTTVYAPREGDARRRSLYAQSGSPSRHSGCDCHVQWRRLSFMPGLSPSPLTSVLGGAVRVPPSRGTPSKPCPSMCACLIGPLAIKYTHKSCVYASQSLMLLWRSDWGPFQHPLNTHQVN